MRRSRGLLRAALAVAVFVGGVRVAPVAATGGGPTGCVHICPGWPTPTNGICRPTSDVAVIAGSSIDCLDFRVELTQASLTVENGTFALKAKSLLVSSGRTITAGCGAQPNRGFTIRVGEHVTIGTNGRLEASCASGGGHAIVEAGTTVSVGGQGIKANGLSGSRGGTVEIQAGGNVSVQSAIEATSVNSGSGDGGLIQISGAALTIAQTLNVEGAAGGGTITLDATGNVTVDTAGQLLASGRGGAGGEVSITANGTVTTRRPIRVLGASASEGEGGLVGIEAEKIAVQNDIIATGGVLGGEIQLHARGGTVDVGTQPVQAMALDVTRSSNNPGDGGVIVLHSAGNDVVVGTTAGTSVRVDASAGGSGSGGGTVEIAGASVITRTGSAVVANSTVAGSGGTVHVESRDLTTIFGTLQANNGGRVTLVYRATPPSPPVAGATALQNRRLRAPCGDGILRAGSTTEQCDGTDLGGATCQSVTGHSGELDCTAACTFDTTGCTGS